MTVVLTKEAVTDRLKDLRISLDTPEASVSPEQWGYREAAAVLASFDPVEIRPFGRSRSKKGEGFEYLVNDITLTYDGSGKPIWSLRADVRRAALERLGSRKRLLDALRANPNRRRDALQISFEEYVKGKGKPLRDLSRDELSNVLQVSEWLRGIVKGIPAKKEVQQQLTLANLLRPLTSLAGEHFRGRRQELEELQKYVFTRDSLKKPQLAVVGVGGTGKSTLISKFILDNINQIGSGQRLPFVYLDFDRPTLSPDQPLTLLVEASRQLEVQFPSSAQAFQALREAWQSDTLSSSPMTSGQEILLETVLDSTPKDLASYVREFDPVLDATGLRHLLIVLDTFEEVQYQGHVLVSQVFAFLGLLRNRRRNVSTLVVTRSDLLHPNTETLRLGDLDLEAAFGFLKSHGVSDSRIARQIVGRVGGNPLSLTLAVELMRKGGAKAELPAFGVQQELIQGQLYRRVLQHIHNADVRKIAHPGLVLRRINPDIILHVLARPCGLAIVDQSQAKALFEELRREDSLVVSMEDGSVMHRFDVRAVMLDLLVRDAPNEVREIREGAVKYYSRRNDVLSRAEEIYYRLSLDQDGASVDARWIDGVEPHLRGSIQELPTSAKLYLASKLDIEIDHSIWKSASLVEWERRIERRATDLLQLSSPREVLKVIKEREERVPGSRLYLVEAQAYQRLHRMPQARAAAEKGLSEAERCGDGSLMLDHLTFLAALEAEAKRYGRCTELMNRAYAVARQLGDNLRSLEVGLSRLVLSGLDKASSKATIVAVEDELAELFQRIGDQELLQGTDLVFDIASEIGATHPAVLRRVIRLCGLPLVSPDGLARVLATWDAELSEQSGVPSVLASATGISSLPVTKSRWLEFVKSVGVDSVVQLIRSLLLERGLTSGASKQIARLLREQASSPRTLRGERDAKRVLARQRRRPRIWKSAVTGLTARKRAIRRLRSTKKRLRKK